MINKIYKLIGFSTMPLVDKKTGRTRLFVVGLCCLFMFVLSLYMLFDFLENQIYYSDSDVFYYMSLADSLSQNGNLQDMTTCPSALPKTPQNAIVIIFYLLNLLVSGPEQSLIIVILINYLALLFSLYPLLKITEHLGMRQIPVRLALISVYLCGWHMMRFQLSPLNCGLFRTTSLWLIYVMIKLSERDIAWKELLNSRKALLAVTCILSAVLIHFRLNALVIPVAAFFSAVLVKRYNAAFLMLVCAVIMVLSLIIPYSFVNLERIQTFSDTSWDGLVPGFAQRLWNFTVVSVPASLFRNLRTCGNMLYAAFLLAILLALIDSVRKKNFAMLFIVFVCMGTFGLLLMLDRVPHRMLLMVYPLLYLILLRKASFRPIGYLFVFAVVTQSFFHFYDGYKQPDKIEFWSHVSNNLETDKSDYVLITGQARQAYYFANMRGLYRNKYTTHFFEGKDIFLAGSQDFREAKKRELENYLRDKDYRIEYINLTEDYQDSAGNAFLRVKINHNSP